MDSILGKPLILAELEEIEMDVFKINDNDDLLAYLYTC